jgi:hypothetical protein
MSAGLQDIVAYLTFIQDCAVRNKERDRLYIIKMVGNVLAHVSPKR